MSSPLSSDDLARIRGQIARGQLIDAIKRYRELTGADLASAKAAVDQLAADPTAGSFGTEPLPGSLPKSVSPQEMGEVRQLLSEGNKIAAIKRYRELTGVGLAEAKEAVENLPVDPSVSGSSGPARLPTNVVQKSGCFGLVILGAMAGLGALVIAWCTAM